MNDRIQQYWTHRAHDFAAVRKNELENGMSRRWLAELHALLPKGRLNVLDVGTGAGFFAILLAEAGHRVCGVDLTEAMLDEARALAAARGLDVDFRQMDAQALAFPDGCFDAVLSRNLTWTLPDPERAYREWLRVLRPGGLLLNFDANYGDQVRSGDRQNACVPADSPYGHVGMTQALARENAEITLSMPLSRKRRPEWDRDVLRDLGAGAVRVDAAFGRRVLGALDLAAAPLFMVAAVRKEEAHAAE